MKYFTFIIFIALAMLTISPNYGYSLALKISSADPSLNNVKLNKYLTLQNGEVGLPVILVHPNREIKYSLSVQNDSEKNVEMVVFNEYPLSSIEIFHENSLAPFKIGGHRNLLKQIPTSIIPAIRITFPPGLSSYSLSLSNNSSLGLVSLYIWELREFEIFDKENVVTISLYFGAILSLFLYNIFLLLVNKNTLSTYFALSTLPIIVVITNNTGLIAYLNPDIYDFINQTSNIWYAMTAAFLHLFALEKVANYQELSRKLMSKWVIAEISLILVAFVTSIVYTSLPENVIIYLSILYVLSMLISFILSKQSKIIWVCAIIPLSLASLLHIMKMSSLIETNFSFVRIELLFLSSLMLILSILIGIKLQNERVEKVRLNEMITLGRSVQDLLLPASLQGFDLNLDFAFAYEPFEGSMSGDWVKHWQTSDKKHHFILGDVTGKGPQAALAVSIISTVVDRCIREDKDVVTALSSISATLFSLLEGKIASTASAATIARDGTIYLFNAGGLGWIIGNETKFRHILGRNSLLGQKSLFEISSISLNQQDWSLIYTFSDGVCNSPKIIKRLSDHIAKAMSSTATVAEIRELALKFCDKLESNKDDKTFLVVKSRNVNSISGAVTPNSFAVNNK